MGMLDTVYLAQIAFDGGRAVDAAHAGDGKLYGLAGHCPLFQTISVERRHAIIAAPTPELN
jgi:hypothetical protein